MSLFCVGIMLMKELYMKISFLPLPLTSSQSSLANPLLPYTIKSVVTVCPDEREM